MSRRFEPEHRRGEGDGQPSTQNAERRASLVELRRRVQAGSYDCARVMDEVARRILKSGDLACDPSSPSQRRLS